MGRGWLGRGSSSNKGHFDGLRQEEPHIGHVQAPGEPVDAEHGLSFHHFKITAVHLPLGCLALVSRWQERCPTRV